MRMQDTKLIKAVREIKLSRYLTQKNTDLNFLNKKLVILAFPLHPSFLPSGITIFFTVVREPSLFMGKCTSSRGSGQGITS